MTELSALIARARRLHPETPALLKTLGLKFKKSGAEWRGHCPEPTHAARSRKRDSGSWQINNEGKHHCFSCHFGGDAFHLVMTIRDRGMQDAALWMIEHFGDELDPESKVVVADRWKTEPKPTLKIPASESLFCTGSGRRSSDVQRAIDYLLGRGLSVAEIRRYEITATLDKRMTPYRGRVIIPIVVRGVLVDFVARLYSSLDPEMPKALSGRREDGARKELALWNYDRLDRSASTVYVTEGVWGAMALIRAGFENVVASCGSAWSQDRTDLLAPWDRIVLIPDGDEAGRAMFGRCSGLRFGHELLGCALADGLQPDSLRADDLRRALSDPKNLKNLDRLDDFSEIPRSSIRFDLEWK